MQIIQLKLVINNSFLVSIYKVELYFYFQYYIFILSVNGYQKKFDFKQSENSRKSVLGIYSSLKNGMNYATIVMNYESFANSL